jgi:hypothetical protein
VQRRPAIEDQRDPFVGVNKAGAATSAAIKLSIALMPIAPLRPAPRGFRRAQRR